MDDNDEMQKLMEETGRAPYWWVHEGYSADPWPCYRLRCDDCGVGTVVHTDDEATKWQMQHTLSHKNRAEAERRKQLAEARWAEMGGRPVKIQRDSSNTYSDYLIRDAETKHVISSGYRDVWSGSAKEREDGISKAIEYCEKYGYKIVGYPRGYTP